MFFDALTAAAIGDELQVQVLDGFVQKLTLPDENSVAMEIYAVRERHQLLLTADPTHPRGMLLSERPTAKPGLVTPFGLLLRKHVLDGVVTEVEQPAGERIIAMSISKRSEGDNGIVWLQAELMGKRSNLLLLDEHRTTILESVKRVSPQMSSVRPILPKRPYIPPPPRKGVQPHRVTPAALQEIAAGAKPSSTLWQMLVGGVSGLSPLAAREIVYRTTGDSATLASDWDDWTALATHVRRLASLWATREWTPCVALGDESALAYAPYELTHLQAESELAYMASMSEAIGRYAGATSSIVGHGQLRAGLIQDLGKRAEQLRSRLRSLREQQEAAWSAQRLMEDGQLVLAYGYSLPPGADKIELEDRTIALDPSLSPAENAENLFDAYKRRKRAAEDLPALTEQAERELELVEEYRTYAGLAEGHAELTQLRAEAAAAGVLREPAGKGPARAQPPRIAAFTAPDGVRVLVGRSAAQNARVLETAAPGDWWFHAREIPGGHVVARTGGAEPSDETRRLAAESAAYHSAARESGSVEVVYTQLRNVRKIKGAGPGQVTYRNERSVRAEPRDHLDKG